MERQPIPHLENNNDSETDDEVIFYPIFEDKLYVKTTGLTGDLPDGFQEQVLDLQKKYQREVTSVTRFNKIKGEIKKLNSDYKWFKGIFNRKNNTAININESTRVQDTTRFKEETGDHYSYIAPEEKIQLTIKSPTQGFETIDGGLVNSQDFIDIIPKYLKSRGVDETVIKDRIKTEIIPIVNSGRLKELQNSGLINISSDLAVTTQSVGEHKYKKPFNPRQFRKNNN